MGVDVRKRNFISGSGSINLSSILSKAFTSSAIIVSFDLLFTKILWKVKILHPYIVLKPNLHGTWVGKLKSSWVDPETKVEIPPIDVKVLIQQTATSLSVEVFTDKMVSTSYLADIHDPSTGNFELVYAYTSKSYTETRKTNPWHDGATKLQLFNGNGMKLSGEYWTTRKITGSIELIKESGKIIR